MSAAVAGAGGGCLMIGCGEDTGRIADLAAGRMPVGESQLDELVARNRDRLAFTGNPAELAACAVVYVAPDVATDDTGRSDFATLDRLLQVAQAAAAPTATIVVLSQVPPGYTRQHRRSEEHTSELQSLLRITFSVFRFKKKKDHTKTNY